MTTNPAADGPRTHEGPNADHATPVRPILKWAGGKRQLLPALRPYYPAVPLVSRRTPLKASVPSNKERLQEAVVSLAERDAYVLLSSSVSPGITPLDDKNARARGAGLRTVRSTLAAPSTPGRRRARAILE